MKNTQQNTTIPIYETIKYKSNLIVYGYNYPVDH
jgi:hypothetical protein